MHGCFDPAVFGTCEGAAEGAATRRTCNLGHQIVLTAYGSVYRQTALHQVPQCRNRLCSLLPQRRNRVILCG